MANNKALYSLAFGNFVAGISAMVLVGISSEMANDLNIVIHKVGHLVTIFALVFAISAPLIAALTGKFDRRNLLLFGMLMIVFGNGIIVLTDQYFLLFLGRIISAIGSATFTPLAILVGISMAKEEEKGKVSSIIFTGSAVATTIGIPFGTYLGLSYGWRYPFWAIVVIALMSSLILFFAIPKNVTTPVAKFKTLANVFKNKVLLAILSVTVVQFGGQMVLFAYISPWLKRISNLSAQEITFVLVLIGVGGIIGNLFSGKCTDKFGPQKVQVLLIIILIIITPFLSLMGENVYLGYVLFLIWGGVGQGFISPQLVRIVNSNPSLSSASLSLNSSFINIGISFGALTAGYFVGSLGEESLTWVACFVSILSLIIFLISWRMEKNQNYLAKV
ncbi:MAG: MFS transporter [Flavobacteriales bacterium]